MGGELNLIKKNLKKSLTLDSYIIKLGHYESRNIIIQEYT